MALASYPPSSFSFFENGLNEQLSNDGIRELAASGRAQPTGRPNGWWALTPPSHPYRCTGASQPWAHHAAAVVFFCSLPLSPAASIFRSRALYAARTFLSPPPLSLHQHLTSRCNRGLAVNCERGRKGPATNQATALPHAKVIKLFHSTSICYAIFFISKRE